MTYWVLILLAVAAGLLLGAAPLAWPWYGPHPVRSTIAMALLVLGLVVLVGSHLLGWDAGRVADTGIHVGVSVAIVAAAWVAPNRRSWEPWLVSLAAGSFLYLHLYGRHPFHL